MEEKYLCSTLLPGFSYDVRNKEGSVPGKDRAMAGKVAESSQLACWRFSEDKYDRERDDLGCHSWIGKNFSSKYFSGILGMENMVKNKTKTKTNPQPPSS